MRICQSSMYSMLAALATLASFSVVHAETVTLTLTPDSFIANTGACYDPLGVVGTIIRNDPQLTQAYLDANGLDELPPACVDTASGLVGLSGTIQLELAPPSPGTNTSVVVTSADVLADSIVQTDFLFSFQGQLLNDIDGAHMNITPGGPPGSLAELDQAGTFSLASQAFAFDGGISTVSGVGPMASLLATRYPDLQPLDLATEPVELQQAERLLEGQPLVPVDLRGFLHGETTLTGQHQVTLYLPFTLGYDLEEISPEINADFQVFADYNTSFDGMIVATGISPFPVAPSSLLVVPEPSTIWLAAMALPLLFADRRRTRNRTRGHHDRIASTS
mgnify:CR=1 FL=1